MINSTLIERSGAFNSLPKNKTEIQQFYAGQNVFITGGTGFIGKILVEKLLWSCPDIGNIYLLMREKKGKNSAERLDDIFSSDVYDRVTRNRPNIKDKVKVMLGDCGLLGLGLSLQDREELIREVNIIFHAAATVRFNEPLDVALNLNLRATQDILEFSKQMSGLKAFVHVSTAFSHCYKKELSEQFYDMPMDSLKLLKFIETADKSTIEAITPRLIGKWPNTYTFSKAMAEDFLKQFAGGMPLGIFRPSIVISSINEPVPCWCDNWYGMNGYFTACGAGLLRVIRANSEYEANVVPVDLCVNALIASAWDVYECFNTMKIRQMTPTSQSIRLYNFALCDNPIKWGNLYEMASEGGSRYPPIEAIWYRCLIITTNAMSHSLQKFFLHWVPAVAFDAMSFCIGKKPQLLKTYKRIHLMEDNQVFFTTRYWNFTNNNILKLINKMSADDQILYPCDVRKINWKTYLGDYFLGIRRYLMKDDDSTLPRAIKKYKRLYYLHYIVKYLTYALIFRGLAWAVRYVYIMYKMGRLLKLRI